VLTRQSGAELACLVRVPACDGGAQKIEAWPVQY